MIEMYNDRTIIVFNRRIPLDAEIIILLVALVVYLTCAVFSTGYLHPDEHFQILEFAKWKLGEGTPQAMAWEHVAKIRPTLQPVLAMMIIRSCMWLGMQNPFHQAMVIRMLTGLVMLFSMSMFIKAAKCRVTPQHQNALMVATLFFWVMPMIGVHFSSEILSTACLLFLLSGLLRPGQPSIRDALWMGFVAALGFEFRYQVAFAYVGILAWILAVGRYRWQIWCAAAFAFLTVVALSTALDSWFYGRFVFAPYNYYYMNIVQHVAAAYGVSPWYTYFLQLAIIPSLALGVPVLLSVCIGTFKHYRNPVVWTFWTFLLFHSVVSHKEARFIFPLMPLLPLFLVWTYEVILHELSRFVSFVVVGLLALVNVGGLVHVAFKPADNGKAVMMQYLCERASEQKRYLRVKVYGGNNPFRTGPLISQFYLWQPVDVEEVWRSADAGEDFDVIVLQRRDLIDRKRILAEGYREVYRSMSDWQNVLNKFYQTYDSDRVLIAYEKR